MDEEAIKAEIDRLTTIVRELDACPTVLAKVKETRDRNLEILVTGEDPEARGAIKAANFILGMRKRAQDEIDNYTAVLSGEELDAAE